MCKCRWQVGLEISSNKKRYPQGGDSLNAIINNTVIANLFLAFPNLHLSNYQNYLQIKLLVLDIVLTLRLITNIQSFYLTWKDIYFDKKVLSVNKQITQRNNRVKFEFSDTKTRDSRRIVPITKVLLNDLKMLYEQDKKDYYGFNDDFFVVSDAKPIADSNIYLRRTKLATLAGLKVIRIHDFRHSCASLLINNGANVTLVAKYLGHTKIEETLNTYSHMFSTALDSVVSVIDSLEDD